MAAVEKGVKVENFVYFSQKCGEMMQLNLSRNYQPIIDLEYNPDSFI